MMNYQYHLQECLHKYYIEESPQDVSNRVDHQNHPGVPAPEPHYPTSQDVFNITDHQHHHPSVPAPEYHHPTPQDMFNILISRKMYINNTALTQYAKSSYIEYDQYYKHNHK